MLNIIKIGEKEKHLVIPEGWRIIKTGILQKTDKYADILHYKWDSIDVEDISTPVEWYEYVIRENK